MTKVLSVTSECVPMIKTGGLADVAGALPGALESHGVEMRTLLPGYRPVLQAIGDAPVAASFEDAIGGPAKVRRARLGDTVLYVLDAPHLYDRDGSPYLGPDGQDWFDNPERFAALSHVAAWIAAEGIEDWRPRVVHAHDWQAALVPVYLAAARVGGVKSLLTIHNIAFQGLAPPDRLASLRLPPEGYTPQGFEYWGQISALKAGIVFADKVSTVSPTYARELLSPEFGMGLHGVLQARGRDFVGILNGIDETVWSPPYDGAAGKAECKAELQKTFGLPRATGPLAIVISRLTAQKGLDLLLDALPRLLEQGGQLALLGSGDPTLETRFLQAATHRHVAVRIGYDEPLSRRMMAGADAILVPSRFEPCGLTQLYGLRFGTVPLVASTGGLNDTVIDANPAAIAAGVATGVQFHPVTADGLGAAIDRLCALWAQPDAWQATMRNAMAQPVGWSKSAADYASLFEAMASG